MRFPSLFRVPRHTRFNYEPRYYDPVKEEVDQRVKKIRRELAAKDHQDLRYSFRETYERKKKVGRQASLNQIIVLAIIVGGGLGWWVYGNDALYVVGILFPLYVFLRIKGKL